MQTRNEELKRKNGITLVALVVTIVVLLILSGVTISTLLGDNGIIAQAKKVAELTKRSTVISSVQLDILMAEMEGPLTQEKLEEILNKYGTIEKNDPENPDKITGLKVEGVTDSIPIEELYPEGMTGGNAPTPSTGTSADNIANAEDKSQYYGKEVDYTVGDSTIQSNLEADGIKWKIFYAGSDFSADGKNHIYLITDDYIARTAIPKSSGGHTLNDGNSSHPKAAYFTNILGDYTGSASITNTNIKKLNNSYFSQNFTSTNNNMKAVAYMLDTNAWNGYKGTKVDYAIGAPTVEMLMKSYNQVHSVDYQAKVSNATGYQVSKDGGTTWANMYSGMLSTSDSLYVISSNSNAAAYWLASPSADDSNNVLYVNYSGNMDIRSYSNTNIGFRPLVCLSSDVKLEKQSDGTFKIVKATSETSATDIANAIDKSQYYGKEVDYTVGDSTLQSDLEADGIKWKIFYAGSDFSTDGKSHIYLITDDYVARTAIPKSSAGHALNNEHCSPKAAYFTNILGDYTGSASVTNNTIKKLNNSYFDQNFTSTYDNWKAVAYMCDTNAWSVYKGAKAEYAVGGPAVEMLMKSYSQKHSVDYRARASREAGYDISKDGGSSWANEYYEMLSASDSLYVITSQSNAAAYWLASPANIGYYRW